MRERKFVKFRVNMYDDTKFKIIDMKPERDLIHYVWNRIVVLAGKVNLEGELYLSKSIPYTLETLAIEFNRCIEQVKLALDVLIELEMVELTEHNIYKVKNFAKHQNIKTKEKSKPMKKDEDIDTKEVQVKTNLKDEICADEIEENDEINRNKINKIEKQISLNNRESAENSADYNLEIIYKDINKVKANINNDLQDNVPITLGNGINKKINKKIKKDEIREIDDEDIEDNSIICIRDGEIERPLRKNEHILCEWSF